MGWEGVMPTVTRDSANALSERVRYPLANESFGWPKSEGSFINEGCINYELIRTESGLMPRYECVECDWTGEKLFDALDHATMHEVRHTGKG